MKFYVFKEKLYDVLNANGLRLGDLIGMNDTEIKQDRIVIGSIDIGYVDDARRCIYTLNITKSEGIDLLEKYFINNSETTYNQ